MKLTLRAIITTVGAVLITGAFMLPASAHTSRCHHHPQTAAVVCFPLRSI